MEKLPDALLGLARYRQFIVYLLTPSMKRPGKTDKTPINPFTLYPVSPLDPDQWFTADDAIKHAAKAGSNCGVGFVFTNQDPFFFLDIDACLVNNDWSDRAKQLQDYFRGAAVEVSQSGKGLHIIGSYESCPPHTCKHKPENLEFYTEARFVALTGSFADGSVDHNCTPLLPWLVDTFFTPKDKGDLLEWSASPVPEWNGPWDDDILIAKAMSTAGGAAIFGGKCTFKQLFEADEEALARNYPDITGAQGRGYDASNADMALALHLAFWTGKNQERMKNIMLRSALVRDKWDREKYMQDTIQNACAMATDVYSISYKPGGLLAMPEAAMARLPSERAPRQELMVAPGMPTLPAVVSGSTALSDPTSKLGAQHMPASEQPDYFRGCVYVMSDDKVLAPNGLLMKDGQFRRMYGGFNFVMDMGNLKTTKSAWECFTESQAWKFPKATRCVFRPLRPPLQVFDEEGDLVVNSYVPIVTKRRKGDPTPFLELLGKLLPDDNDRQIILSYMAACLQYPGMKAQWCPILQGCEGNGKSYLLRIMAFCTGYRHTHFPNATDLANKFNGWLRNKLFIGVEEFCVGDKLEILESLKPMITNTSIELQGKSADQITFDNYANFIMTTNYKDAIRSNPDTRRWCMFYTAQQSMKDIVAYGMHGSYFPVFKRWLDTEGYEIVNDFLRDFQIPEEFNPAGMCIRAPVTSTSIEARAAAAGTVEQEVQEAVDLGLIGFRENWISSVMLARLLTERHLDRLVPPNRRRAMLQHMGYDWHPMLKDSAGRTPSPIMSEGNVKPVLFYKTTVAPVYCRDPADVRTRYMQDQGYEAPPLTSR